jgi:molybdopterin converting factor small subunit
MHVRVKLMSLLRSKLPPGSTGGTAQLELGDGATVGVLMDQLGIAAPSVHLVMVNGAQETDRERTLQDGDEIVLFPPMAGGA